MASINVVYTSSCDDDIYEVRSCYLDVAHGPDGKTIIGVCVSFNNRFAIVFRTPEFTYAVQYPKYSDSITNTHTRVLICKNEKTLLSILYRWLNDNRIGVSMGIHIDDDIELIKERMAYHGLEFINISAFRYKSRIWHSKKSAIKVSFAGMNFIDGGVIHVDGRNHGPA